MFGSDKIQIFLGKIGIALRLTNISKYLKLIRTTFPSPAPGIRKMVSFPSYQQIPDWRYRTRRRR
jgi:hypothetical protein